MSETTENIVKKDLKRHMRLFGNLLKISNFQQVFLFEKKYKKVWERVLTKITFLLYDGIVEMVTR